MLGTLDLIPIYYNVDDATLHLGLTDYPLIYDRCVPSPYVCFTVYLQYPLNYKTPQDTLYYTLLYTVLLYTAIHCTLFTSIDQILCYILYSLIYTVLYTGGGLQGAKDLHPFALWIGLLAKHLR